MIGTPDSFTPSPALQRMTSTALELREAYQDAQRTFTECEQETRRLEQVAAALDAEADQAEQAGKELAMSRKADQRKINAAFEQAAQQRMDAEKYRRTAQMRGELRFLLIKQMASARGAAAPACRAVTAQGIREQVAALLETEGLAALIGELRALLKLAEDEGMAEVCDGISGLELGRLLESVAATPEARPGAAVRICLPASIAGEMPAGLSSLQLKAFELSKGQTLNLSDARQLAAGQ